MEAGCLKKGVKKLNIKKLKYEESKIDEYVKRFYPQKSKYKKPCFDGITDVEKYLDKDTKYKICWVLKEPYEDEGGYGDYLDLREMHRKNIKKNNTGFSHTWDTISCVSYSLLNGFTSYKKIKSDGRRTYMQSLLQISFINVNKMRSETGSRTKISDLRKHYESWKPILHWQLSMYNPDIIIFGRTCDLFWKDLVLDKGKPKRFKGVDYVLENGKIYICHYHPAHRTNKEDYFNKIIGIVKKERNYIRENNI